MLGAATSLTVSQPLLLRGTKINFAMCTSWCILLKRVLISIVPLHRFLGHLVGNHCSKNTGQFCSEVRMLSLKFDLLSNKFITNSLLWRIYGFNELNICKCIGMVDICLGPHIFREPKIPWCVYKMYPFPKRIKCQWKKAI